jgi:molybdopterin synthase sulfur carrier subunit
MKVHLSTHVRHYTHGAATVEASGGTLEEVLLDLDRQFPGLKFRLIDEQDGIRKHMNIFINDEKARGVKAVLNAGDELHILGALSGG